ncbi:unnamed protein product [Spirodela intermedia]|uniref:Retroviral polymerase SH3-like domain-containing protein n=1 Tax=Spirodela intermedia TaxID=51605 RepID=A0A7I8LA11_SPIIN|nr:unnamed protein product [Spirodela intermedia]
MRLYCVNKSPISIDVLNKGLGSSIFQNSVSKQGIENAFSQACRECGKNNHEPCNKNNRKDHSMIATQYISCNIYFPFFVFPLLDLSVMPERFIRRQYKYWRTALRRANALKGKDTSRFKKGDGKIHDKPPNYGKFHLVNAQNEDGVEPMIQGGASQDGFTSSQHLEIEKLREEIRQLRNMISSTSLAHTSKHFPKRFHYSLGDYSNTQKGYKFYDPRSGKFIVTIYVTFDESKKQDLHVEILKEIEAPETIPAPPPPPNRFG